MLHFLIINGPNLNLLGQREPKIYGSQTFEAYFSTLQSDFSTLQLSYLQSNSEGKLIDYLQENGFGTMDAIILNAGAYTHTSLAIADAIAALTCPVIEVHLTNIFKREPIRHTSLIAPVCRGSISGFGLESYRLAIQAGLSLL